MKAASNSRISFVGAQAGCALTAFVVARCVSGGTSWIEAATRSLYSSAGRRSVKEVRRTSLRSYGEIMANPECRTGARRRAQSKMTEVLR